MLCTAPTLRSAALGVRIQPTLLTPYSYSTSTAAPLRSSDSSPSTIRRRVSLPRRNVLFKTTSPTTTVRAASSISTPPSSNSSSSPQPTDVLDWNTFFRLRRRRRFYQLGSSISTSALGFATGASLVTNPSLDPFVSQIPLDPFITLGLMTFACAGTGWLLGPVVGTGVFNLQNRKLRGQMDEKEKEFYRRVKKFRVDPSASSMANPVPDYYGEKIASVAGYRQWLKDQRAFNKKRKTYV